jgi:hypothetical protein
MSSAVLHSLSYFPAEPNFARLNKTVVFTPNEPRNFFISSTFRQSRQSFWSTVRRHTPSGEIEEDMENIVPENVESLSVTPARVAEANTSMAASTNETTERFTVLRQWEGYVQALASDGFTARVTDMKNPQELMEVEIDLEEIPQVDRPLVEIGAIFYWTVGYNDKPTGRQRTSDIKFRRLPVWIQFEIEEAQRKGRALASKLSRRDSTAAKVG